MTLVQRREAEADHAREQAVAKVALRMERTKGRGADRLTMPDEFRHELFKRVRLTLIPKGDGSWV